MLRKGEDLLFRLLHGIMEITFFFSRLVFISVTSPLVLYITTTSAQNIYKMSVGAFR